MKLKIKKDIELKAYSIISDAIEDGINWGYNHAHKHTDSPSREALIEQIHNDVMNELCEKIDFGD